MIVSLFFAKNCKGQSDEDYYYEYVTADYYPDETTEQVPPYDTDGDTNTDNRGSSFARDGIEMEVLGFRLWMIIAFVIAGLLFIGKNDDIII